MNLTTLDASVVRAHLESREDIPTLPTIVTHLINLGSDPNTSLNELAQTIAYDPIVTAKVLRVANSSYMGLKNPVRDLPNAVFYLGIGEVRRIALAVKSSDLFAPEGEPNDYLRKIWLHSLITGFISSSIAGESGFEFTDEAYVAGLLHDFGKLFFATSYPTEYAKVCEAVAGGEGEVLALEEKVFGMTHLGASKALFAHWRLPNKLGLVAEHHHNPMEYEGSNDEKLLILCAAASNLLAHYALADDPGDYLSLAEEWLTELVTHRDQVEQISTEHIQAILETAVMRAHMIEGVASED